MITIGTIVLTLLAPVASVESPVKRIGAIELFGHSGMDGEKVRGVLPFHETDEFNLETFAATAKKARDAVATATGRRPTDVAPVCCDKHGDWIIYIGLSGKTIQYEAEPTGEIRLPNEARLLYERFMKELLEDVQAGSIIEDHSQGYALSKSKRLRPIQLEMRAFALKNEATVYDVLKNAQDDRQRTIAAQLAGYAQQSDSQLKALVSSTNDSNETVRNNATRALIVLAGSSAEIAKRIPADHFAELLLSGTWTDINKATNLLNVLTRDRNPKVLTMLRKKKVLERLIEVARWRSGHAIPARHILGRLADIDETRIKELVREGKLDVILNTL